MVRLLERGLTRYWTGESARRSPVVSDRRRVAIVIARWSMLAGGVFLTTYSFVQMATGNNERWWRIGLIGVAATVVGLGTPWSGRRRDSTL
jgi:hypothetical protein